MKREFKKINGMYKNAIDRVKMVIRVKANKVFLVLDHAPVHYASTHLHSDNCLDHPDSHPKIMKKYRIQ